MPPDREDVTRLLQLWRSGDNEALDQLMPIVYDELRRLAARCLRSERPGHTLARDSLGERGLSAVVERRRRLAG